MSNFWHLPINPNLKIQLFPLSMLILIGKNLYDFLPHVWKLHNPHCHNEQGYYKWNFKLSFVLVIILFLSCIQARLWACGRGDVSVPSFRSLLNPISTKGADYAHSILVSIDCFVICTYPHTCVLSMEST